VLHVVRHTRRTDAVTMKTMKLDATKAWTALVAVIGAAVLVGSVAASLPWQVSLAMVLGGAGVLVLATVRVVLQPGHVAASATTEPVGVSDPRLRFARLTYYLGAAMIGLLTVRPALGFTASDWVFVLSLALLVIAMTVHDVSHDYLVPTAITLGVALFAVGGLISTRNAVNAEESLLVVIRMLYLTLVWFWLGTIVLQTRLHVENAIVAWVFSAAVSSSGALVQYFEGDVIPGGALAYGRMTGFTPHFNDLGGLVATAFVPALVLAVESSRRRVRGFGVVSLALLSIGLLLSGSVGAMLAASVATTLWLAIRGLSLKLVISVAAVVASGFVVMTATGATNAPNPVQRITKVFAADEAKAGTGGTVETRLQGYGEAWSRIQDQPFVGVGLDHRSGEVYLGDSAVHNIILNPWFSAGLFGMLGIAILVWGAFSSGFRAFRNAPLEDRALVAGLLSALVAFVVFAMGAPIMFVRYGWFPTALLVAVLAQQARAHAPARRRHLAERTLSAYKPAG
jgi:O-antigen ligase